MNPSIARLVGLLVLVGTLTACDLGQPAEPHVVTTFSAPPPDFASGTRLRARYHLVEGVFQVFTTFHDAALGLDCAYQDESGAHVGPLASSYCLPQGMAKHREGVGPFVDRACTVPAATAPPASTAGAAPYAVVQPLDACATELAAFAALPPRVELTFEKDAGGACRPGPRIRVHRFGDRLSAGTFVRATEQVEPRPGRIDARVLVGDDGSRRVVGGFDRHRMEATRIGITEDGVRRWVPARSAFIGAGEPIFADPACAVPVASKIGRTATCPLSAAVVLEGTCGRGRYLALGDRVPSPFRRDERDACAATPAPEVLAFRVGPATSAASYAPIASFEIGTPRVRRRGIGVGGDRAVVWDDVIDAATDESCQVVETQDGSLRCLPAAAEAVFLFADDGCTAPAFARATTGCEVGVAPRFVRDVFTEPSRAFLVTAELRAVYTLQGGRCTRFGPMVASRTFAVEEVATVTFPRATLVAE